MNSLFRLLAIATVFPAYFSVAAAGGLRVVEHAVPATLEAGSRTSISIVVANDGSVSWSSADGFAISYHWLDTAGEIVVWDGLRSPLSEAVVRGAGIELMASVEAPRRPGDYLLHWDVVQEGVQWLSETDATPPEPIAVSVFAGRAFTVLEGIAPRVMMAGSESVVELVLHNDGSRTWTADGVVAAAYHWLGREGEGVRPKGQSVYWEGRRTSFPAVVRSGETVAIEVVVVAPDRPGLWRLQWDLVEEGVCWFSDRAPEPLPSFRVLVISDPWASGFWWSLLVLCAGAAAVSTWRSGGPRALVVLFSVGDVVWCVSALSVKQAIVLAESGAGPTVTGWLLIVAGASVLALVTRILPERFQGWAYWGFVAGATLLLWADSIYLRFFGDLPATAAIAGVCQLGQVEASIRDLFAAGDAWLWLDLLPGAVLVLVADRLRRGSGQRRSRGVVVGLLASTAMGAVAAVYLALTPPNLLAQVFRRVTVAKEVGVLNLHAVDSARAVGRGVVSRELEPAQFNEVVRWFRERAPQRAGAGSSFAVAEDANLVMVQVESLQAFVVGLEIGGREVTPFLNCWAEDALWFSNVTDQTGQGRSSDSELATQVSLLPMVGGAAAFRFAANDFTGMAEVLGDRGYHTLSAVPYEGAFWNRRETHPAYGFRRNLFVEDFNEGENVGWGLSDRDFLEQTARRLATGAQPFAAYLLTLSLHHPFDGFPPHLEELDVGIWDGTPFGNFLHTMHFFDASLAAFVAVLEHEGIAENTVIAIWGDHDAGFPWRSEIAVAMGSTHDAAGWYLSQEVPLFINVPGADLLRGERAVPAGHADVAPTLLALLGVDATPYAFVGRNLLGEYVDGPVVGEYGCWRTSTHLFLQGDGSLDDGACIELATMAPVPSAACREGFYEAMRTEEVSSLVLEHDLQRAIHQDLVGELGPGR
jgi:phosphoglycerol transferase MdoB-like AlkP superfamily enzyme